MSFIWNARNRIVYLCWHGNIETNTLSIILEGDEECKNISSLNIECSSTTRTTNAYIFLSTDMCTITWQTVVQCVIFVWLKSKLEQNTHRSIEMVPFWCSCSASICGKNTVFFGSLSLSHCEIAIEIGFAEEIYDRIRRNFCVSNCVLLAVDIVSLRKCDAIELITMSCAHHSITFILWNTQTTERQTHTQREWRSVLNKHPFVPQSFHEHRVEWNWIRLI